MKQQFERVSLLLVAFLLVAGIGLFVTYSINRIFDNSSQGDYGEGTVLGMVERSEREPISIRWFKSPPYTISPYGPGYYSAVNFANVFLPWKNTLIPGRLVSLFATLFTAGVLAICLAQQLPKVITSTLWACFVAYLFLMSSVVFTWGMIHRVDALAMLFSVAAFLLIEFKIESKSGVILSAALIVIGSLVKQSVALTAIPLFVFLLLNHSKRSALLFALLVGPSGILLWGLLNWSSDGYYLETAIRGNVTRYFPTQAVWYGYQFLTNPIAIVACIVMAIQWIQSPSSWRELPMFGAISSVAIASLLSGKEGAAENYFLESSALMAYALGIYGWKILQQLNLIEHTLRYVVVMCLCVLFLMLGTVRELRTMNSQLANTPYQSELISTLLQRHPAGFILADAQLIPAVLFAKRTPIVNDPFLYRVMVEKEKISTKAIIQLVEEDQLPLLFFTRSLEEHVETIGQVNQKWPEDLLEVLMAKYEKMPDSVLDSGRVYVYRLKK